MVPRSCSTIHEFLGRCPKILVAGWWYVQPSALPEGDPVSVVAMILVTMFVAEDLQQTHNVELQSFVDNWSLQTPCPVTAVKAAQQVTDTTGRIAMVMAMNKVKFYSTDCDFRIQLRSMKVSDCPLKDLGVCFAAVSRQTAQNYKDRFQKVRFDSRSLLW